MAEYIEREAVMDALFHEQYGYLCEDAINSIPAADVRPVVRGKWEELEVVENDPRAFDLIASMRCNKCNRYHNEVYHHGRATEEAHFCSFCGADMREES